eukprot:CAMPEP_0119488840 /NCGR_PEP_ID=MMETSP1344-20130328/14483_1 /TAXON_ID=236787 /ORGANISM="Florenciella parvula, Strain CCMP2471" /LENGTH=77 /DNA_ID=CAMNT_0007523825 /DNA_START=64 /DNA_END=295 /DNA_ORIENTATION=+
MISLEEYICHAAELLEETPRDKRDDGVLSGVDGIICETRCEITVDALPVIASEPAASQGMRRHPPRPRPRLYVSEVD